MNTERLIQLAKDADLVLAENVIAFTLKKLRVLNILSGRLCFKNLKFESLQRRNPELANLIKFLKLADRLPC